MKKKVQSIRQRIKEGTGPEVTPIYYCAGYKEEGREQLKPYNLTKLLYYIVQSVLGEKRLALVGKISYEEGNWIYDDEEEDYKEALTLSYTYSIGDFINEGEDTGGNRRKDFRHTRTVCRRLDWCCGRCCQRNI